jgi:hypothetical protein
MILLLPKYGKFGQSFKKDTADGKVIANIRKRTVPVWKRWDGAFLRQKNWRRG